MSSVYGFRPAPSYNTVTAPDLIVSALDQPMSGAATFFDQATGGILDSFGLGTAIRETMTPDALEVPKQGETTGQVFDRTIRESLNNNFGAAVGRGARLLDNQERALSEDEWKKSPAYREEVPYDPGMTEERAKAISEFYDAKKVREFYASKRPITAFFGNFAGQATDPINYIPIFGPATKAAAVARAGRIGGAAITSAGEAAVSTALTGALTAPIRSQFGDDVSFQAQVTDIALSALIGTAFGSVAGTFDARRAARLDVALAEAETRLGTLKRTQEARVALNDAVQSFVDTGEVRVGGSTLGFIDDTMRGLRQSRALPSTRPASMFDLYDIAPARQRELASAADEISSALGVEFKNPGVKAAARAFEKFQEKRAVAPDRYRSAKDLTDVVRGGFMIETPQQADDVVAMLGRKFQIEDEGWNVTPVGYFDRKAIITFGDGFKAEVQLWNPTLLDAKEARGGHDMYAEWRVLNPKSDRALELAEKMRELYDGARASLPSEWSGLFGTDGNSLVKSADETTLASMPTDATGAGFQASLTNTNASDGVQTAGIPSQTAYFTGISSEERMDVDGRIGKPERLDEMSKQFGVDPKTGDFAEAADLESLRAEGRLTADDEAVLMDADKALELGDSYGEALRAAVSCLL
jgi:hypothetical protein